MADAATRAAERWAPRLPPGDEPPYDGDMEARLRSIETILPTLATKVEMAELRADVQKGFADQTKWIIGTGFAGIAVFITVMTFVLNNAVPKAPTTPVAQPPAIIINVPGPAPQQPQAPAK